MTVYLVISLPKVPYINHIYMVLANPMYTLTRPDPYLNTVFGRAHGEFPAKNSVYAVIMCLCMVLVNPVHTYPP